MAAGNNWHFTIVGSVTEGWDIYRNRQYWDKIGPTEAMGHAHTLKAAMDMCEKQDDEES